MSPITITSKAQIDALEPGDDINIEIVGEHLTYFTSEGRRDSFDVPRCSQTMLAEGPMVVQVTESLRYDPDCGSDKAGQPVERGDIVRIPAVVEFVTDPHTEKQYPAVKAVGALVSPAE